MKYDARACKFNMDTGCVELLLRDGRMISIDCTGVEDELDVTMAQRTELDYLIYNDPLSYADLILNGDPEKYLKNVAGRLRAKQKTGCALRTHPAKVHIRQRYVQQGVPRRERSVFLCWWCDEPVPPAIGKLAFAQRSGAMKAPVGLLSDRTVLRKQDGGASPRQVTADLPRCSSRQGWLGRMPAPDGR